MLSLLKKPINTIQKKILVAMSIVAIFPLVGVFFASYFDAKAAVFAQTGEKMASTASLAMGRLERELVIAQHNVHAWSELDIITALQDEVAQQRIGRVLQDYLRSYETFSSIVVADREGIIVAASADDLLALDIAESEWFAHVVESGQQQISDLQFDERLGGYGVSIASPIRSRESGKLLGVINANYDWQELLSLVQQLDILSSGQDEHGYAVLLDREGYVIAAPEFLLESYQSDANNDHYRVSLFPKSLVNGGAKTQPLPYLYKRFDGHDYLVTIADNSRYKTIHEQGWRLLVFRDAQDALSTLIPLAKNMVMLFLATALLIVLISSLLARHIAKPLLHLNTWVRRVASGQLDYVEHISSQDEVGDLAASFDAMRKDLKKYIDEISQSKQKFQGLVESLDGLVWQADARPFRYTYVSQQIEKVSGYTPEEWVAQPEVWEQSVDPAHRSLLRDKLREAAYTGKNTVLEFRAIRRDGRAVWVKNFISGSKKLCDGVLTGVAVDITDIKRAEEEMIKARDLALRTAKAKEEFLAIVSHEIRTPLNGLLGMLETIDEQSMSADQADLLNTARDSGNSLLSLANDVLDFTRLESGSMSFNYATFNFRRLVEKCVCLVAEDAFNKQIDLGAVCEKDFPEMIVSDEVKLTQLLMNLLSNAVKFTQDGSILVWAEVLGGQRLYVEVKDTGVGVNKALQRRLFNPYQQAEAFKTRSYGGAGLGLALCQRILERMGGRIGVSSIPGMGSSFYFELPISLGETGSVLESESVEGGATLGARLGEPLEALQKHGLKQKQPGAELGSTLNLHAAVMLGDLPATHVVLQSALSRWHISYSFESSSHQALAFLKQQLETMPIRWVFMSDRLELSVQRDIKACLQNEENVSLIEVHAQVEPAEVKLEQAAMSSSALVLHQPVCLEQLRDLLTTTLSCTQSEAQTINEGMEMISGQALVVDDNAVNQRVVQGFLTKLGLSVDLASDGAEALKAIEQARYDIVFMDCQMPVMDGYEATRRIRRMNRADADVLPIIAITANAMAGDRERCLAAGMNDYLPKPVRMPSLLEAVRRWVLEMRSVTS